ncbi:protein moonraker isoform X1 [Monodelphis domestica]|uniref:protein moonraker isoform X1 n=1 Tax=Monodelphis domestica TaxID=13616 RepID=UPI0024E229AB|nr:protein moonraker isoform X1 [Monodelphis domestica]
MGPSKLHTQLQFNRNVPSIPDNLAIRYSGPRPIIIEKLRPPGRASAPGLLEGADPQASVPFSVVSEEKLNVAVHLARRDVRRKQLENLVTEAHAPRFPQGQGQAQARGIPKSNLRRNEPTKKPRGPFPARQQTSHVEMADPRPAAPLSPCPEMCSQSDSPPTHDPGSQVCAQPAVESRSMLELRRLQKELSTCIQRMEKVAAKDGLEEDLEPDKAERSRVRRQEQTIRTARVLYGLQQQVKEIQEELDKLGPHEIKHTKKSRAMSRLAAAHRGAIRALQSFVKQFTDSRGRAVSERYRELGTLIRQLSLCSAKLDNDPSVPDVVLELLQQIEELDSLLEKKPSLGKIKRSFPGNRSQSPLRFPGAFERSLSASPARDRKPCVAKEKLAPEGRWPGARRLLEDEHVSFMLAPPPCQLAGEGPEGQPEGERASSQQDVALRGRPVARMRTKRPLTASGLLQRHGAGPATKSQQKRPRNRSFLFSPSCPGGRAFPGIGPSFSAPSVTHNLLGHGCTGLHKAERLRPRQAPGKDCRFQRTTVSSRLKRNHPPAKDLRAPWIPPNPTSPPASPKCVAWGKASGSPKEAPREPSVQQEAERVERPPRDAVEREALRKAAWPRAKTSAGGPPASPEGKAKEPLPDGPGASAADQVNGGAGRGGPGGSGEGPQRARGEGAPPGRLRPTRTLASRRLAWLDAESSRRIKELEELRAREMANVHRLSTSASELVDKVEKVVLERLKPLLDRAKEVNSLEASTQVGDYSSFPGTRAQSPEKVLPSEEDASDVAPDNLAPGLGSGRSLSEASEPEAQGFQHEVSPTLWTMMQRMEEMERCQEAVRQRFSQMVYADPDLDFGTTRGRSDRKGPAVNERPRPPHPIQLTKRAASWEPAATVLLEKPLDEKYFDESMDMEERGEKKAPLRPVPPTLPQQPEGSTLLSVPRETLRSLGDYQDSYQQYLRTISHESVGSFNPWIIVESLAEELVEEALEDVAAELQDVCEDYAEAVFTSEFLEPSK